MAYQGSSSDPVQSTVNNWNQRLSQLSQMGLSKDKMDRVVPLANADIKKVEQGGTALTQEQVDLNLVNAINSPNAQGIGINIQPLEKHHSSGGIFSDIMNIPKHVVSDVASIGQNAIPGMMHLVGGFLTGKSEKALYQLFGEQHDAKWMKAHGYEALSQNNQGNVGDLGDWFTALRDVAKAPGFNVIPGLHTVSSLTSANTAESLLQHPVYTTLDVAGAVSGIARAGLLGTGAEEGTAAEALQAGHPMKALYQQVVPESARASIAETTGGLLKSLNFDKPMKDFIRGYTQMPRKTQADIKNFVEKSGLKKTIDYLVAHRNEDEQLQKEMMTGHYLSPEHEKMGKQIEAFHNYMRDKVGDLHGITHNGKEWTYPTASPVYKTHDKMVEEAANLKKIERQEKSYIQRRAVQEVNRLQARARDKKGQLDKARARLETLRGRQTRRETLAAKSARSVRPLREHMITLEKQVQKVNRLQGEFNDINDNVANIFARDKSIRVHANRIKAARDRYHSAQRNFESSFRHEPPASVMPLLKRQYEGLAMQIVTDRMNMAGATPEDIAQVMDKWNAGILPTKIMSPEELNSIKQSVYDGWEQTVKDTGIAPVWYHEVTPGRSIYSYYKPLTDREATLSVVKKRVGNLSPATDSVALSLMHEVAEYEHARNTQYFLDTYMQPHTVSWKDAQDEILKQVEIDMAKEGGPPRGMDIRGMMEQELSRRYATWDPGNPFESLNRPRVDMQALKDDTMLIDRRYLNVAHKLTDIQPHNLFGRMDRKGIRLYKASVMTFSAKHVAHIVFGGAAFLLLRGGPDEFRQIGNAFRMWKNGEIPYELPRGADFGEIDFDTGFHTKVGEKQGNLLKQYWNAKYGPAALAQKIRSFDDMMTDVYRADSFLAEQARGLRKGLSDEAAREQGLQHVYKTFVDMDAYTPFERTIVKSVFPWYAYMKHVIGYLLSYPIDYPARAAIMARFADQEMEDQKSGLPSQFNSLFYIGSPSKTGNVTGVEMKQFNPFRDVPSYVTLAGFTRALRPDLGALLTAMNVDKFTGTSQLYPKLAYNSFYGTTEAKGPGLGGVLSAFAENVSPEFGALDYYMGLTQDMRKLRASNPTAATNALYNSLLLPFQPKKINVVTEGNKIQNDMLALAQQDVSAAMKSGDTSTLKKYVTLPFNGQLLPAKTVISYIDALAHEAGATGISPRALSKSGALKPKGKRSKL